MRRSLENAMDELRCRSAEALAYFIDRYTPMVASIVSSILDDMGAREDIEECVSDVFVRAWKHVDQYDSSRGTIRAWFAMLAKYEALDRRRQLRRRIAVEVPVPSIAADPVVSEVLSMEHQQALVSEIERLEPSVRDVVVCRYLLDMPISDIARKFNLTRSQVDNRLYRARQRLRQRICREPDEGDGTIGDSRS